MQQHVLQQMAGHPVRPHSKQFEMWNCDNYTIYLVPAGPALVLFNLMTVSKGILELTWYSVRE